MSTVFRDGCDGDARQIRKLVCIVNLFLTMRIDADICKCACVHVSMACCRRRTSSTTSSIFDLSSEAERLDLAIRENDVNGLRKIIAVHLNKFNLTPAERARCLGAAVGGGGGTRLAGGVVGPWNSAAVDTWSCSVVGGVGPGADSLLSNRTRSHSYSTASGCCVMHGGGSSYSLMPYDCSAGTGAGGGLLLVGGRKYSHSNPLQSCPTTTGLGAAGPAAAAATSSSTTTMMMLMMSGGADNSSSRRESSCTTDGYVVDGAVVPWIFKNALHAAIEHDAVDVLAALLTCGVDPNRTGTGTGSSGHATDAGDASAAADTSLLLPSPSSKGGDGGAVILGGARGSRDVRFCLQNNEISATVSSETARLPNDEINAVAVSSTGGRCRQSSLRQFEAASSTYAAKDNVATGIGGGYGSMTASHIGNRTSIKTKTSAALDVGPTGGVSTSGRAGQTASVAAAVKPSNELGGLYTIEYLYSLPPLFLASVRRNVAAVRLLLAHGASPDVEDAVGRTPVQLNSSAEFQSWPCAATLVEYGARIRTPVGPTCNADGGVGGRAAGVGRDDGDWLGPSAVELCPELADRQVAILRERLLGLTTYCARHRELVARRAEVEARQAAAAVSAKAGSAAGAAADAHFRGFDAATRFFRRSNQHPHHGKASSGSESMRHRGRRDSAATIGGRRTTNNTGTASGAELSFVEIERESTTWIEGGTVVVHDEDSVSSTHSGGRLSFTFRPTLTSFPPSQYDDIGFEFSTASGIEAEKVEKIGTFQSICILFESLHALLHRGSSARKQDQNDESGTERCHFRLMRLLTALPSSCM
jgi:hypothetical protein